MFFSGFCFFVVYEAFEHKKCLFCGSKQVRKDGAQNGKQRYRCVSCHKRSSGGQKPNPNILWQCYSEGKQTAAQLAGRYGCSIKTIRRYLAKAATQANGVLPQAPVNLVMDTTCFGRKWGVMVLYDACSKRALTVTAIERETNALYMQAVAALRESGVFLSWLPLNPKPQSLLQTL